MLKASAKESKPFSNKSSTTSSKLLECNWRVICQLLFARWEVSFDPPFNRLTKFYRRNAALALKSFHMVLYFSIGTLLFILWFWQNDSSKLLEQLGQVTFHDIIIQLLLMVLSNTIRGLRLYSLLLPYSPPSLIRVLSIHYVGIVFNGLLPVRGGEIIKILMLRTYCNISSVYASSAILLDRLLMFTFLFFVIFFLPLVKFQMHFNIEYGLLVTGVLYLFFVAAVASIYIVPNNKIITFLQPFIRHIPFVNRHKEKLEQRIQHISASQIGIKYLSLNALFTVLMIVVEFVRAWHAFAAVGYDENIFVAGIGWCVIASLFFIPTPPGNIGTLEYMYHLVFVFGFERDAVFVGSSTLFIHFTLFLSFATIAAIAYFSLGPTVFSYFYKPQKEDSRCEP